MRKLFFFLLVFLFVVPAAAQDKLFTVEDVIMRGYSDLMPDSPRQLKWVPNTDRFVMVQSTEKGDVLVGSEAGSDDLEVVLSVDGLNKALTDAGLEEVKSFPRINFFSSTTFYWKSGPKYFAYNGETGDAFLVNQLPDDYNTVKLAPNNQFAAFTQDDNLFAALEKGDVRQITTDGGNGIVNGETVHRNEFGISGGIFWSPKSNYIAYYRKDESMVTDYPILELDNTPATVRNIKYPMAGQKSHHVTIGVYDIKAGTTTWLDTGLPAEQYLTCVTWGPDEKFIYTAILNRDQNHFKFMKFNAVTGEPVKMLFEEKSDKYVEPENDPIFLPGSSDKFLWLSERDGYDHYYLYDTEGTLIKQVTSGEWVVTGFEGFDESGENIFFTAAKDGAINRNLYKVNIESGDLTRLTKEDGYHNVSVSSSGDYAIDSYTSLDVPRIVKIVNNNGETVNTLHESADPLKEYKTGKIEHFQIKAADGVTDLNARLVYPPDFDPNNKYPVIVFVYGGPHAQMVLNTYPYGRYHLWFQLMAQKGYLVFTVDNRGSANRGRDFEQVIFRNLGEVEVADQLAGLDYLKTLGFADLDRVGVFGWSYGGFMTGSLMMRTDGAYKVGVAGGTVCDWKYYEVMYGERYMDTPESNPEGYEAASLLNRITDLKGKLLLLHGTSDPVVVWQHSLMLAKKAAENNIPLDYFPYIHHGHGVGGPDAIQMQHKITDYFLENL